MARNSDDLQKQIDTSRREIHTDQYAISIGELTNLYRDGELDIHPEFQRFFRWEPEQKSRFIESILCGIPIPSLFVAQRRDGKWDVIDGLQRLSTIFQLTGDLKDEHGVEVEPLTLTRTKYLPAMAGKLWRGSSQANSLSPEQQLLIKRAKLDVKIVLRESDEQAKYELFQRLNTGGAELSGQEIRNAMLVATNKSFYEWLVKDLSEYDAFKECRPLSERQLQERFDVELALRFVVLRNLDNAALSRVGDLGEFLTDSMIELARKARNSKATKTFKATFDLLQRTVGENAFRRYDYIKGRFSGAFLISGYEAVSMGVAYNLERGTLIPPSKLEAAIKSVWKDSDFVDSSGMGVRASTRIPKVIPAGRRLFAK